MASQKAIDNSNRLRYIRALERFHKSMISYLSNTQELTKDSYIKKIDNALKLLNRVEEVAIYKGEIQDLQKLVKKMINYKDSDEDIESIKEDIFYSSNQLDKSKNARRYKKDKHQKSKFSDWD
jgi:GTP-dependent phosphoenolpyruvate carboxykinase